MGVKRLLDKRIAIPAVAVVAVAIVGIVLALRGRQPAWPPQVYDYKPVPGVNPGGIPIRPMDTDIFVALEHDRFTHAQLLDLFPDKPYHVKLVADESAHRIILIAIDENRSGKFKERWQLKPEGVFRYLPADEGAPPIMFTLRAGYWIPH